MNILLSTWSLQLGGTEVMVSNLASELAKRGHRVIVFVESNPRGASLHKKMARLPGITLRSLHTVPILNFVAWKVNALSAALGGPTHIHKMCTNGFFAFCVWWYRIDVIHSHSAYADHLRMAKFSPAKKVVFTDHNEIAYWAQQPNFSLQPFLRQVSTIVSVSYAGKKWLTEEASLLTAPVEVIYNGVAKATQTAGYAARAALGIGSDAFVFGMVGRASRQKGWHLAVEAFLSFQTRTKRTTHLILVGVTKAFLRQNGLSITETNIHLVEETPLVGDYIEAMDVGLAPSCYYEGLPTTVIEYLLANKPVIASELGGIPEIVHAPSGTCGQLLPLTAEKEPRSVDLAEAMERYVLNEALYAQHSQAASQATLRFRMETCVDQYCSLYNRLIHA
ncbi:MAG: glycosyltransferase family 4 protein [Cyclobacteriaceae bacterium]|jgi:glycosyltransferase involved in cell wall biosynthesis|nr:glycosyltransferase family 4 protein [Cyclobacteriaceae bacterium]